MSVHDDHTWLTPATHERLLGELGVLTGAPPEPETSEAQVYLPDRAAREARIARINELLKDAVVGAAPPDDGVAEPGMVLTVRYDDGGDPETFLFAVRDRADDAGTAVYSPASPLGRSLAGAREGEHRSFTAPNGRTVGVTLVRAVPYAPPA